MWFIGKFENGSWGFQQEGCPPRYTSRYEAECIKAMYEALKALADISSPINPKQAHDMAEKALAKAEGK